MPPPFGPSRDWIKMVKQTKARNKIRQFFKNQIRKPLLPRVVSYTGYIANKYLDKNVEEILPRMSAQASCRRWLWRN